MWKRWLLISHLLCDGRYRFAIITVVRLLARSVGRSNKKLLTHNRWLISSVVHRGQVPDTDLGSLTRSIHLHVASELFVVVFIEVISEGLQTEESLSLVQSFIWSLEGAVPG